MKTSLRAATPAAVLLLSIIIPTRAHAQVPPPLPPGLTGELVANPKIVRIGERPKLTWKINYPSVVKSYVTITDPGTSGPNPGTIETLRDLYADVRILGQGVTVESGRSFVFVPTEAQMSINSTSNFKAIFYGINPDINPNAVVDLKTPFGSSYKNNLIPKGQKLRFGGRYYYNRSWGPTYRSSDGYGQDNVRFLVNGDTPPSNIPSYNAPSLESFIRPYLDSTGKVKIGPMDVIVFMELTHSKTQKSDPGYDLQDLVLLVTFRKP